MATIKLPPPGHNSRDACVSAPPLLGDGHSGRAGRVSLQPRRCIHAWTVPDAHQSDTDTFHYGRGVCSSEHAVCTVGPFFPMRANIVIPGRMSAHAFVRQCFNQFDVGSKRMRIVLCTSALDVHECLVLISNGVRFSGKSHQCISRCRLCNFCARHQYERVLVSGRSKGLFDCVLFANTTVFTINMYVSALK